MKPTVVREAVDVQERRGRVYPNGIGRSSGYLGRPAPTLVSGEGYYVWDSKGDRKIDLNNNFTTLVHGHAHQRVTSAAIRALTSGACFGLPNTDEVRHAEALLSRVPWCDYVRYANTGTEAMMTAVRMARALTGRDKIVGLSGAYHGTGDALLPMTYNTRGVPKGVSDDTLLVRPDDEDAVLKVFREHGAQIAAVVLDLMPMSAGGRPLSPSFVASAALMAQESGALLIVDEVVSFRVAVEGFANSAYGLTPDLMVTGKSIGGGLPVAAVLGKKEAMGILDPANTNSIDHGGTFSGNPVSMAAGLAALEIFEADEVGRLNGLGERLRRGLGQRGELSGWAVYGYGSVLKLEPLDGNPTDRLRELFWKAYAEGVCLSPSGTLAVSTPMDESVVDILIDGIDFCFRELV